MFFFKLFLMAQMMKILRLAAVALEVFLLSRFEKNCGQSNPNAKDCQTRK